MSLSRRDFMKLVGVSVASLSLTRCKFPFGATAKSRLRKCWLSFDELAQVSFDEAKQGNSDNTFGQELIAEHRAALADLETSGEITQSVADLIQEAYVAAVYHIWASNSLITCYEPMMVDYAPDSASIFVQQAEVLEQLAGQGTIDPATLEAARTALEQDMAFYAMTNSEVSTLYDRIRAEWHTQEGDIPSFEELDLEITPDAQAAAQFIISLLTDNPSN